MLELMDHIDQEIEDGHFGAAVESQVQLCTIAAQEKDKYDEIQTLARVAIFQQRRTAAKRSVGDLEMMLL